jgi:hypothetical protein
LIFGLAVVGLAIGNYLLWQKEAETRAALQQVAEQRSLALANEATATDLPRQAEANLNETLNMVRDLLSVLDKKELVEMPGIERVRRALADYVLRHYQLYLDEQSSDLEIRHRTARAYVAVGLLCDLQCEPHKAGEALVQSVALCEAVTCEFPEEARHEQALAHSSFLVPIGLEGRRMPSFRRAVRSFFNSASIMACSSREGGRRSSSANSRSSHSASDIGSAFLGGPWRSV